MENKMDFVDVSEEKKEKDSFMLGIYISLVVLVILGLIVYFFGYGIFESLITV